MGIPLHVLIVEDSSDDMTLMVRELRRGGYEVTYQRVETAAAMQAALETEAWDAILSDYSMPSFSAVAALKLMQEKGIDVPFIIVSGTVGEDTAVAAMKAGAHDFFAKGKLTRLVPAIERELREAQERRQRRQAEDELRALYNATSYLFKASSLVELGQQIVHAVVTEFGQVDCGLMLVDPQQGRLIRLARSSAYGVDIETPLEVKGPGLVPAAVRTGRLIYAPDVQANPLYVPSDPRTASKLVIPLPTAKSVLGVLDLQSTQLNAFSERDQRVISAFAERAAAAIEIMTLYEAVNRHAAELEQRVAHRTAELQRVKERVEAILNDSSDAILLVTAEGRIEQANLAFYSLFAYDHGDEIIGQSIALVGEPDQREALLKAFNTVLTVKRPLRVEIPCRGKGHKGFIGDLALAPLTGNQDEQVNVICSIRDITQRKQAEEELQRALVKEKELNELRSRFVSMVSHEFRTPLTTILTSSDLLKSYGNRITEDRRQQHLDKIQSQVDHLIALLNDVLAVSKAETVGVEVTAGLFDLETLCQSLVEEIRQMAPTHRLELAITGHQPAIHADEKLIRQIITNLLTNAVKYSPTGSTVHLGLLWEADHALLRIKDQGIGIAESDQQHLFEPFHRARNVGDIQGTGLGLAIVKQAVEAHGGTIRVESQVGEGTTIIVSIPLTGR